MVGPSASQEPDRERPGGPLGNVPNDPPRNSSDPSRQPSSTSYTTNDSPLRAVTTANEIDLISPSNLFRARITFGGEVPFDEKGIRHNLSPRYLNALRSHIAGAALEFVGLQPDLNDDLDFRIQAASISPNGRIATLISIQDRDTKEWLLPRELGELETAFRFDQSEPCWAMVLIDDAVDRASGEGVVYLDIRPVLTAAMFERESRRVSEGEFQGIIGNLIHTRLKEHVKDVYSGLISAVETGTGKTMEGVSYIVRDSLANEFLIRLGQTRETGATDVHYAFALTEVPAEPDLQHKPKSAVILGVNEWLRSERYVPIEPDDYPRSIAFLAESSPEMLKKSFGHRWQKDWTPEIMAAGHGRNSREALLLVGLRDKDFRFYIPSPGRIEPAIDTAFSGFLVLVNEVSPGRTRPKGPLLEQIEGCLHTAEQTGKAARYGGLKLSVEGYALSWELMHEQLKLLSTNPNRSMFFDTLINLVDDDLRSRAITPESLRIDSLQTKCFDLPAESVHFVHMRHNLGRHVIKLTRLVNSGLVFTEEIRVDDFFPSDSPEPDNDVYH